MEWIKLIIGAIVVVAWIANALKDKAKVEQKAVPMPPRNPADAPRQPENLHDFIMDVRRKLEGSPPPEPPLVAVNPPPLPDQEPRRPKKRRRGNAPPPLPQITQPALQSSPQLVEMAMPAMPAMQLQAIADTPRTSHTAVRDAIRLLRTRSTLASAIVLQETLGPPLAKRRPLRPGMRGQAVRRAE